MAPEATIRARVVGPPHCCHGSGRRERCRIEFRTRLASLCLASLASASTDALALGTDFDEVTCLTNAEVAVILNRKAGSNADLGP